MALVEIDLVPFFEDEDWEVLDNIAKKRLKQRFDMGSPSRWKKILPCLGYTIKVNYYQEDIEEELE